MTQKFILALDQGTTSSRALIFDHRGRVVAKAQQEFPQHFPQPGWVEHDPADLWETTRRTALAAIAEANLTGAHLAALGLTNQRETTLLWERATGRPLHRAIVWQDRRTAALCAKLKKRGLEPLFCEKTGSPNRFARLRPRPPRRPRFSPRKFSALSLHPNFFRLHTVSNRQPPFQNTPTIIASVTIEVSVLTTIAPAANGSSPFSSEATVNDTTAVGAARKIMTVFNSTGPNPAHRPTSQPNAGAATVFSNAAASGFAHFPPKFTVTNDPPTPSNPSGSAISPNDPSA